jgi:hypothetical protein
MNFDWQQEQSRMKQSHNEALAVAKELAKQEASPQGMARIARERLQDECKGLNQQLGARALQESLKIQAANPTIPDSVAFNLAAKGL